MPLRKGQSVAKTMHELKLDNMKSGKARGMNGTPRSQKQMVAIALAVRGKKK